MTNNGDVERQQCSPHTLGSLSHKRIPFALIQYVHISFMYQISMTWQRERKRQTMRKKIWLAIIGNKSDFCINEYIFSFIAQQVVHCALCIQFANSLILWLVRRSYDTVWPLLNEPTNQRNKEKKPKKKKIKEPRKAIKKPIYQVNWHRKLSCDYNIITHH